METEITPEIMEHLGEIETIVRAMAETAQYRQYVEQRKLHLLSSELKVADKLLELGLITV